MINLGRPCPYLETGSKLCIVYENRFKVCRDCRKVTLYHALLSSLMPESCAYVRKYRKLKFLIPRPGFYGQAAGSDCGRQGSPGLESRSTTKKLGF